MICSIALIEQVGTFSLAPKHGSGDNDDGDDDSYDHHICVVTTTTAAKKTSNENKRQVTYHDQQYDNSLSTGHCATER